LTIDQALQFIISCGVVLPAHQLANGKGPLAGKLPAIEVDASSDDASRPAVDEINQTR